jgi:gliding motility-associated-like protein
LGGCWQETPPGGTLSFTLTPQPPALPDRIAPIACEPDKIQVIFSQPLRCNSIAADGSDFTVSGPMPVTVTGAKGICTNGVADTVELQLAAPIYNEGNYEIRLRAGSDGNTLISKCWITTPAGASTPFATKDTVNARFDYTLKLDCEHDTVNLTHDGAHDVNSWSWSSDGTDFSTEQHPVKLYSVFGAHEIQLIVSNGVCSDTAKESIFLENELNADFSMSTDLLCPQDVVSFTNKSTGKNITGYSWDFGNGVVSSTPEPTPQSYQPPPKEKTYDIRLVVQNYLNCFDTATYPLKVAPSCYVDVPTAFTPNRDGQNDYLYPLFGYKTVDLRFAVYNRLGQVVFETNDWTRKWDGTLNGKPQNAGIYVWMLSYTRKDTGEKFFKKGTTLLIR